MSIQKYDGYLNRILIKREWYWKSVEATQRNHTFIPTPRKKTSSNPSDMMT